MQEILCLNTYSKLTKSLVHTTNLILIFSIWLSGTSCNISLQMPTMQLFIITLSVKTAAQWNDPSSPIPRVFVLHLYSLLKYEFQVPLVSLAEYKRYQQGRHPSNGARLEDKKDCEVHCTECSSHMHVKRWRAAIVRCIPISCEDNEHLHLFNTQEEMHKKSR